MSLVLKDPEAVVDYLVDWGAEYLGTDEIADSRWSVSPEEPGGVTAAGSAFDAKNATVMAAGGVPGRVYRLVNTVTLASGRTDSRSVVVRVEQR